jgi:hypothetical protein
MNQTKNKVKQQMLENKVLRIFGPMRADVSGGYGVS